MVSGAAVVEHDVSTSTTGRPASDNPDSDTSPLYAEEFIITPLHSNGRNF